MNIVDTQNAIRRRNDTGLN